MDLKCHVILGCFLAGLSSPTMAQKSTYVDDPTNQYALHPVSYDVFDLAGVKAILANPMVRTVEDFLAQTPEHLRDGTRLTAAFASRGVLPSSSKFPNFFLYGGPNSTVVLVFNAKPTGTEGSIDEIELLSYDKENKRHDLGLIQFDGKNAPKLTMNPSSCVRCHGSGENVRPLFQSAYSWEGFFGADKDYMEHRGLDAFVRDSLQRPISVEDPRMDHRPDIVWSDPDSPFAWSYRNFPYYTAWRNLALTPNPRVNLLNLSQSYTMRNAPWKWDEKIEYGYVNRRGANNLGLGMKLTAQHSLSLAKRLRNHKNYKTNKMELLYKLRCGHRYEFPDKVQINVARTEMSKLLMRFGIAPSDWYMNLNNIPDAGNGPVASFQQHIGRSFHIVDSLSLDSFVISHLVEDDPELLEIAAFLRGQDIYAYNWHLKKFKMAYSSLIPEELKLYDGDVCEYLRQKSLEEKAKNSLDTSNNSHPYQE